MADAHEDYPQPFDAKRLEPAKRRKHSDTYSRDTPVRRDDRSNAAGVDELPQPFDAKKLEPVKKRQRSTSPSDAPRKLKRPGQRARITGAQAEELQKRREQRDREAAADTATTQAVLGQRGTHDVVREHYNAVPERGRDWRRTDSRIKGLRSFNNWVKSTIIQKFSPDEDHTPGAHERGRDMAGRNDHELLVLDIGCGKGGDLGKWQQAPQHVALYVGLDPADVSIDQAKERYHQMRRHRSRLFDARFHVKDCYGESIEDIEVIRQVGFDTSPMGRSGFDIVSMMFCMHYAFESEEKARRMLQNVSASLKKGGRFIGTIPNSDVIGEKVTQFNERMAAKKWGNDLYRVRFPGKTPEDGIFRPPFGWKYNFFLDEAVEEVPEYVVPWHAFRALAEDYNLELQYHQSFREIWEQEKDDPVLGPLSERMGVRGRGRGDLLVSPEEMDCANFYVAFCFYKV
ncbi:mRNA capping enzyme-domain-containing protein [Microdochium trichocladiopsis]|uniref:mRNA cap guanine-N(7) methyltransferase n=1 Tax=Microdochium trichocladiopsis TaxID=1682393 RepID=A0A9P8YEI8_9PEZI|nr:mRNA capping enzyme-domain-containing protein [Microdochium trichocladiopsis]KAH7040322.1 mRNA capping enzyme-domain-containing protein [Microdochium trichocladiopsis]